MTLAVADYGADISTNTCVCVWVEGSKQLIVSRVRVRESWELIRKHGLAAAVRCSPRGGGVGLRVEG